MCMDPRLVAGAGLLGVAVASCVNAPVSVVIGLVGGTLAASAVAAMVFGNGERIVNAAVMSAIVGSAVAIGEPMLAVSAVSFFIGLVTLEQSMGKSTSRPVEGAAMLFAGALIAKKAPQAVVVLAVLLAYAYMSNSVRAEVEDKEESSDLEELVDVASKLASLVRAVK